MSKACMSKGKTYCFAKSAGPSGHQAEGLPLNSFRFMSLIHQAFDPPVFSLILQPSVLQYSILQCPSSNPQVSEYPRKKDSETHRATPPSQKSRLAPQHWVLLPVLGVAFQRPLSHSVRWGSIFSDPYRILCFRVSKTHGKVLLVTSSPRHLVKGLFGRTRPPCNTLSNSS